MRMRLNSIIILFFLSSICYSQEYDFQTWSGLRVSKKIYKRTILSVKQGLRLRENSSLIDKSFTDFRFSHRFKKTDIQFALGYRLINDANFDELNEWLYRYYVDLSSSYKYKRFTILIRDRIQYQSNSVTTSSLFRQKTEISYNIRKNPFDPFFACEYFIDLYNQRFTKLRYTIGGSHPLLKDLDLACYYRIQQDIQVNDPDYLYILGLSLKYKL